MPAVNEDSTAYLTVTPKDKNGDPQAPTGMSYAIHDAGSGKEVRGSTNVSPGSSVEITLTPGDNAIFNIWGKDDKRRVTVVATYAADDQVVAEFVYDVVNLRHV